MMIDIYFTEEYGKLCEFVEPGKVEIFTLKTTNGTIRNMFIKKKVPWQVRGVDYYDIVTPYGYGGPIIIDTIDKKGLLYEYQKAFSDYCRLNNIVCEFIRYHPLLKNWEHFGDVYENQYSRHTIGTNLKDFDDPVQSEFSKSARKEVRRAIEAGVSCAVIHHPNNLIKFRALYEETMRRNHANAMYYFPDDYYRLLTTSLKPFLLEIQANYEGETIASEIYFSCGDYLHAHLLGSSQKLFDLYAGSLIEATAARWGKEHGYSYIHHGGGRTSAEDDPLFLYKKKFGKNTQFDFFTGRKIWNPDVYDYLLELRKEKGVIQNLDFFPQYRA